MATEEVDVLIVGGGQAGLAMSGHLRRRNIDHLVLEKDRIAERWRSERWDSLVANGPAWHDRFPDFEFPNCDPNGFPGKEEVADYFAAYADKIKTPIRTGVEVTAVSRHADRRGFQVTTTVGTLHANFIVAATGPFQKPIMPDLVPDSAGIHQIHSSSYRNPEQLPDGAVLVVGAGSSGGQIADELLTTGRTVYLSVGPHDRPPRRYRGYDYVWWLGVLGKWDLTTPAPNTAHVTISVSGSNGGHTVDFRNLAARGMNLVGMTESYVDGRLTFAPDLKDNIIRGDTNYLSVLDEADAYVERMGLDFPEEPAARVIRPEPDCMTHPTLALDLAAANITSIIWSTGYVLDFSWLQVDAFDDAGNPQHQRGVSTEVGVYFLGLPWLSRRGSSFIWGVWHDASYIADQIAIQRAYWSRQPDELL